MRTIVVSSAGALLLCALVQIGCVEEERVPARVAHRTTAAGRSTVVVKEPRPSVTAVQPPAPQQVVQASPPATQAPASPPIINNVIEPSQTPSNGASANVAPPAYGATEAQGSAPPEQDERSRASQVVAQAAEQIDRMHRIQSMSTNAHREGLDNALYDPEHKREKLLRDLRELDVQPPAQRSAIRAEMERDLADLQGAIQSSYRIAPPSAR